MAGNLEKCRELVARGADLEIRSKYRGETALMRAAEKGHLETLKYLTEAGADIHTRNNDGQTAVLLAAGHGHLETVKWLTDAGADIDKDIDT